MTTKYIETRTANGYTVFADTLGNYQAARLMSWLKDNDFVAGENSTSGWTHAGSGQTAKFIKRLVRGQNCILLQVTEPKQKS